MHRKLIFVLCLGAIVTIGSGLALAEVDPAAADEPVAATAASESQDTSVVIAGMTISIDPKTGRMRPLSPAEAKQLGDAMRANLSARPRLQQRPRMLAGGTTAYVLDASQLKFAVARTAGDGTVAAQCVDHPNETLVDGTVASSVEQGLE